MARVRARALNEIDQLWRRGDLTGALAALDALLAREPANADALNFAGWLRTSQRVDDAAEFERGVAQLKAALAAGTTDHRPAVNLAEALGPRGRAREAVEVLRPWCEAHPAAHFAWNSLGWLLGVVLGDAPAGLAALQRVAWLTDAQLNLGRIHLAAGRLDEAEPHFAAALNSFRPHEAWLRLGELAAVRGQHRRALGALRRAWERGGEREFGQPLLQAITGVGNRLLQEGKYFLHAADDSALSQEREQPSSREARVPPSLEELAARAREVRAVVSGELAQDCEAIERCAATATLWPELADQPLGARLAQHGPPAAKELAREWRAAQLALYEELLEREEPSPRDDAELRALRSALARRDWDGAFAALAAVDRAKDGGVELVAEVAERLGDQLHRLGQPALAARAWAMSEDAFAEFASWSTSGAEGSARMVAVNRLRAKRHR